MTVPAFDPGWLRRRIVVEAPTPTPDGAGGETVAWSTLAALWSRIEPAGPAERTVGDHLAGVVSHTITIRWRDDVAGGQRILYRGRRFSIRAVGDPDETQRYLVLSAEEERA